MVSDSSTPSESSDESTESVPYYIWPRPKTSEDDEYKDKSLKQLQAVVDDLKEQCQKPKEECEKEKRLKESVQAEVQSLKRVLKDMKDVDNPLKTRRIQKNEDVAQKRAEDLREQLRAAKAELAEVRREQAKHARARGAGRAG